MVFEEVIIEIEAQYHRFLELFGRKPDYFEGHAVASANFFKGLEYVAEKYGLKYSGFPLMTNRFRLAIPWLPSTWSLFNQTMTPLPSCKRWSRLPQMRSSKWESFILATWTTTS